MYNDPLNETAISAGLSTGARAFLGDLQVHAEIDSTMSALARGDTPWGAARVCLAEAQNAGRGRRGRAWVSPPGGNIYLSAAWTFRDGIAALGGLSLAVGVLLCEALEDLGAQDLTLKWPNDVLREGRKLAGVLVELQTEPEGACTAIVGIGINVRMPPAVAPTIEQPWSDLHDLGVSRDRIASRFLDRLLPALADYETTGFEPYKERWEARHEYADRWVRIDQGGKELIGQAEGVDGGGALLLRTAEDLVAIHGGEVSLRPHA